MPASSEHPKKTWTGRYDGQIVDCHRCGGEGKQRAKTGASNWRGVCNDCYRQFMRAYNRGESPARRALGQGPYFAG